MFRDSRPKLKLELKGTPTCPRVLVCLGSGRVVMQNTRVVADGCSMEVVVDG